MKRTSVYIARKEAWEMACYAADLGAIPWRLVNNMHMLKEPFEAPHLAPCTPQHRSDHIRIATQSRNACAKIVREIRASSRGTPKGMKLHAVRIMSGTPIRCFKEISPTV